MKQDLEIVKALIKEMNEELTGKQKNIDVAAPFGKSLELILKSFVA